MSEFSVFGTHFTHQRDRTHTLRSRCVIDIITALRGCVIFPCPRKVPKRRSSAVFSRRTTAELPPPFSVLLWQDFRQQGNDF